MAASGSDLFKWKRQTKTNSHFASRGTVQDWIKRVQSESDAAAKEIFGDGYRGITPLEQVHIDDDALTEAQDLLDMWIQPDDDTQTDLNLELEYGDEKWSKNLPSHKTSTARARNDLDDMVFSIGDDGSLGYKNVLQDIPGYDVYRSRKPNKVDVGDVMDDELNEAIAVQEVLHGMLNKTVVSNGVLNDLGFEKKKFNDPRTKMELRHQQVKQKSDDRRQKLEQARRENISRKDAEQQARQQVMREEKEKQARIKREEQQLQTEMAKIRKIMEEEKKRKNEELERQTDLEIQAETYIRQQMEAKQRKKHVERQKMKMDQEEMRQMLLSKIEEQSAREAKERLRIMQKCFSSWYSVVVERRIQYGKAGALSDWRRKLRAWNAWRAFIRHLQSDRETQAITLGMKEKHRKEKMARAFHNQCVRQRYFTAWQNWVQQQQDKKELIQEHEQKSRKMAALLEAAASGKLWTAHEDDEQDTRRLRENSSTKQSSETTSKPNTARQVEDIFTQPARKVMTSTGSVSARSDSEQETQQRNKPSPCKKPKQAWTVKNTSCEDLLTHRTGNPDKNASSENLSTQRTEKSISKETSSQRKKINTALGSDRTKPAQTPLKNVEIKGSRKDYNQVENPDCLYGKSHQGSLQDSRNGLEIISSRLTNRSYNSWTSSNEKLHIDPGSECGTDRTLSQATPSQTEKFAYGTARSESSSVLVSRKPVIKSDKPNTRPMPLALAMEQRAKERAERKALMEEQRKRVEDEKLEKMKLEQEQREKELLAEREALLDKKKEEKRLAKQREIEKQKRIEALKVLNTKADHHYHTCLLRKYGLKPWTKLVNMTKDDMRVMTDFSNKKLVSLCFYPWLEHTQEERKRKQAVADNMYQLILMCRGWRAWRKYGQHLTHMDTVARAHRRNILMKKCLKCWQDFVTDEQMLFWEKEKMAEQHNINRLQKQALTYWRKYIPMMKEEKVRELRRIEMRKKVQSWLPDFHTTKTESP